MVARSNGGGYPVQYVVDPGAPCVIYRAVDPQTLERSTDHGRTWSQVFHDNAPLVPPSVSPFWGSSAVVSRSGQVGVSDWGNGDGFVESADGGNSWTLHDQGIAGRKVIRVVVAPANPNVEYAMLAGLQNAHSGPPHDEDSLRGLAVTGDGGASWSLLTLPLDGSGPAAQPQQHTTAPALYHYRLLLAVDPRDPNHIWLGENPPVDTTASSSPGTLATPWFLYESTDRGGHWQSSGVLPVGTAQLTVIRSNRHPLRLVAAGSFYGYGVAVSDDGGTTWRPTVRGEGVVRPRRDHPDEALVMLYTGRGWAVGYSVDGLDTVVAVATPPVPLQAALSTGGFDAGGGPVSGGGAMAGFDRGDLVAVDDRGTYYVSFSANCLSEIEPMCPPPGPSSALNSALWEFTPPSTAQIRALTAPPGLGSSSNWSGPPPVAPPLATATGCPLPVAPSGSTGNSGFESGNVVYDGRDVLYTHYEEYATHDYEAVIHAVDPLTCATRPDILVHFDPNDAPAWDAANAPAQLRHPWIDNATYDARRNVLWAIVDRTTDDSSSGGRGNNLSVGLFMIRVSDGAANPRKATAQLAFLNGCDTALSYDQSHDTLWTCNGQSTVADDSNWAQLSAQTGSAVPSCATQIGLAAPNTVAVGAGTWAVTAPDRLYTWNEDDTTFTEYETATCQPVTQYSHRPVVEPTNEDEQMACDTVSFAADSAKPVAPHGALWLRDSAGSSLTAYAIPDAYCPVQTVTTVQAPPVLQAGTTSPICIDLQHLYLSGSLPMAGRTVELSVHGPVSATLRPAATTAQARCVPWSPAVPGTYTITATFASAKAGLDAEYLSSSATTTVQVNGVGGGSAGVAPRSIVALVEPPAPPPPPISSGGVGTAPGAAQAVAAQSQAQAQAQSQSQAQAQSVTQAQPGVMVRRQQRTQIATQKQTGGNTVYEARALRRATPSPLAAVAAGFSLAALLGLGRRPSWARARSHRRPRRRY